MSWLPIAAKTYGKGSKASTVALRAPLDRAEDNPFASSVESSDFQLENDAAKRKKKSKDSDLNQEKKARIHATDPDSSRDR